MVKSVSFVGFNYHSHNCSCNMRDFTGEIVWLNAVCQLCGILVFFGGSASATYASYN